MRTTVKLFGFVAALASSLAGACGACPNKSEPNSEVNILLERLETRIAELSSYQAQLEYTFAQPLLESRSIKKGVLYYYRGTDCSKLRINFQTLRQDDEKEQKYAEDFVFDGIWLIKLDYQLKQAEFFQQAPEDKPTDAFDLAGRHLPIIGFARIEDLKKHFQITLVEPGATSLDHLHLTLKPSSTYKDTYTAMDLWLDKETSLPTRITAESTEQDIYDIKLLKAKTNKKLQNNVFEVEIPANFSTKRRPLPKGEKRTEKG